MFGLIVGTLCLLGLFATLRRRHYFRFADYYGYHWGHHHGRSRWHHHGDGPGFGRHHRMGGFGRRRGNSLHFLFAELDTTPGQEKAIILALDALREATGAVRKDWTFARRELADIVAGDVLDGVALDALLGRQQEHLGKLSQMLRDFVALVHEALNPVQRKRLAELLADGTLALALAGYQRAHHHHHQGC